MPSALRPIPFVPLEPRYGHVHTSNMDECMYICQRLSGGVLATAAPPTSNSNSPPTLRRVKYFCVTEIIAGKTVSLPRSQFQSRFMPSEIRGTKPQEPPLKVFAAVGGSDHSEVPERRLDGNLLVRRTRDYTIISLSVRCISPWQTMQLFAMCNPTRFRNEAVGSLDPSLNFSVRRHP